MQPSGEAGCQPDEESWQLTQKRRTETECPGLWAGDLRSAWHPGWKYPHDLRTGSQRCRSAWDPWGVEQLQRDLWAFLGRKVWLDYVSLERLPGLMCETTSQLI